MTCRDRKSEKITIIFSVVRLQQISILKPKTAGHSSIFVPTNTSYRMSADQQDEQTDLKRSCPSPADEEAENQPMKKQRTLSPAKILFQQAEASLPKEIVYCVTERLEKSFSLYSAPEIADVYYHFVMDHPEASLSDLATCDFQNWDRSDYNRSEILEGCSSLREALAPSQSEELLQAYFYYLYRADFQMSSAKSLMEVSRMKKSVRMIPRHPKKSPGPPSLFLYVVIPQENEDEARLWCAESFDDIHYHYLDKVWAPTDVLMEFYYKEKGGDIPDALEDVSFADLKGMFEIVCDQDNEFTGNYVDHEFQYEEIFVEEFDVLSPPPITALPSRLRSRAKSARSTASWNIMRIHLLQS